MDMFGTLVFLGILVAVFMAYGVQILAGIRSVVVEVAPDTGEYLREVAADAWPWLRNRLLIILGVVVLLFMICLSIMASGIIGEQGLSYRSAYSRVAFGGFAFSLVLACLGLMSQWLAWAFHIAANATHGVARALFKFVTTVLAAFGLADKLEARQKVFVGLEERAWSLVALPNILWLTAVLAHMAFPWATTKYEFPGVAVILFVVYLCRRRLGYEPIIEKVVLYGAVPILVAVWGSIIVLPQGGKVISAAWGYVQARTVEVAQDIQCAKAEAGTPACQRREMARAAKEFDRLATLPDLPASSDAPAASMSVEAPPSE